MINGVSTYTRAKGGPKASPFGYQGNLLAQGVKTGFVNTLLGQPNKSIYDKVAEDILPDNSVLLNGGSDNNSSSNSSTTLHDVAKEIKEKLPTSTGSNQTSKINTTPADTAKATNMVSDATNKSTGNPIVDSTNQAAGEDINSQIHQILNSNTPAQEWKQAVEAPFYKNNNFYRALFTLGVALASRSSPIAALQLAMNVKHKGETKDMLNANMDMLKKEYDPASVMAAMQTGDASKLKAKQITPEQKAMLDMAVSKEQGKMQLSNQEALSDYNFEHQKQLAAINHANSMALKSATARASGGATGDTSGMTLKAGATPTEKYEYETLLKKKNKSDKDWQRLEDLTGTATSTATGPMDSKEINALTKASAQAKSAVNQAAQLNNKQMGKFEALQQTITDIKADMKAGNTTKAQEKLASAYENIQSLLQGGLASVDPAQAKEIQEYLPALDQMQSALSNWLGFGPTQTQIEQLDTLGKTLGKAEKRVGQYYQDMADQNVNEIAAGVGADTRVRSLLAGTTGIVPGAKRSIEGLDEKGRIPAAQVPVAAQNVTPPNSTPVTVQYQGADGKTHTINTTMGKLSKENGQIYITINGQKYPLVKQK